MEAMADIRGVVAVLVCCLTLAAAAQAAEVDDRARGRVAFDEGRKLFQAGEYREALASFKKGFLSSADPAFLLNIAQCHRFLGEPKEAVMMYRLYLKTAPEGSNREGQAVATKAIRDLEREAADPALAAIPPMAGAAPEARTAVPPVAAPVPANTAAALPPPSATEMGHNRRESTSAYPVLGPLPELDVTAAPAAPPNRPAMAASTARHLRLAGVVCAAAGVVSVGAGVYYWTSASSLADRANKATVYNQNDYDQGKRAETMQWIFYSVGAVTVVTGAALYFYGRWSPSAKRASVALAPTVGPGGAGVMAQGAF